MKFVKLFCTPTRDTLETSINDYLKKMYREHNGAADVFDIKYSITNGDLYHAMLIMNFKKGSRNETKIDEG